MATAVVLVSIPTSASVGDTIPVGINLRSLLAPGGLYAFRASALYTKYPYIGTPPVIIPVAPVEEINLGLGDEQLFTGYFTMPAFSVTVTFNIEAQAVLGGAWASVGTESGIVTLTAAPSPTTLDMASLMSLMIQMMIVVMMMKMMTSAMSTI